MRCVETLSNALESCGRNGLSSTSDMRTEEDGRRATEEGPSGAAGSELAVRRVTPTAADRTRRGGPGPSAAVEWEGAAAARQRPAESRRNGKAKKQRKSNQMKMNGCACGVEAARQSPLAASNACATDEGRGRRVQTAMRKMEWTGAIVGEGKNEE